MLSGTVVDYNARKVDLYLSPAHDFGVPGFQELNPSFGLAHGGTVCTGFVKLVQKALMLLLTQGRFYDIYWGTSMGNSLRSRNLKQAAREISAAFAPSGHDVVDLLRSEESIDTPLDERIDRIDLVNMAEDPGQGRLLVVIEVAALSQDATVVTLPITWIP